MFLNLLAMIAYFVIAPFAHGSPDEVAADWASRLASAGPKIERGVRSVTTAPGQAAARQKEAYRQGVANATDKWAARVASVSLPEWQQAMIEKGANRIASGAQAAQPKMAQFLAQFLPHVDQVKASLPPRGNLDQNIDRMTKMARGAAQFKRR